jgi:dTDP-4-dehydrorhamnose reductase
MRICVTGHRGRLGSELVRVGCIPFAFGPELEADITDLNTVKEVVDYIQPDAIINCAAFTAVDACEQSDVFEKAMRVNKRGVGNLLEAFTGRLIHISTDYVFSGTNGPYSEKQKHGDGAVNAYGWTKLGGEAVFLSEHRPGDIMIRTTGLYGNTAHHDFVKLVRTTLEAGKPFSVTRSLHGNQTYIPHLAEALIHIAHRPDEFRNITVLHVAGAEVVSRYEFALKIAEVFGLDKRLLNPVNSKIIPGWVADRPTKGGLRIQKAKKLGVPIYTIRQGLEALRGDIASA